MGVGIQIGGREQMKGITFGVFVLLLASIVTTGALGVRDQRRARREILAVQNQFAEFKSRSWELPRTCIENQRIDISLWQPPGDAPDWKPGSMVRQSRRGDRHQFYCRAGVWVQDDKSNE